MKILKNNCVRILHVVSAMNRGGAETLIMNLYRNIDRSQVQFDFAVNSNQPCDFDNEIYKLGGRIFFPHSSPTDVGLIAYGKVLAHIINEYGPFAGVHSHVHHFSGYVLNIANKSGISLRLAHSHTTQDDKKDTLLRKVYRWYMTNMILKKMLLIY